MRDHSDERWLTVRKAAEEILEEARQIQAIMRVQREQLRKAVERSQEQRLHTKAVIAESEALRQNRRS